MNVTDANRAAVIVLLAFAGLATTGCGAWKRQAVVTEDPLHPAVHPPQAQASVTDPIEAAGRRAAEIWTWPRRGRALYQPPPPQQVLGTKSDHIWQIQERNAEASDFLIYMHEFQEDTARLNMAGRDHIKQIAYRLTQGQEFPIVVERSMTTPREDTRRKYPIHPSPKLDRERREIVVRLLTEMGIADAERRVFVGPATVPGQEAEDAERVYRRGILSGSAFGGGFGGFGGFGAGFGGFGGFGAF